MILEKNLSEETQRIPVSRAARDSILKILWNAKTPITLNEVTDQSRMSESNVLVVLNSLQSRGLVMNAQFKGKSTWFPR